MRQAVPPTIRTVALVACFGLLLVGAAAGARATPGALAAPSPDVSSPPGEGAPELPARSRAVVARIPISGNIEPGLARFVSRALGEAHDGGADAVLVEINTFGGRVDAATDIRDALLDEPLPVVVWVRERAWSAGALITLAADRILMAPGSSIGAAEPRPAEEKTISALRAEFASTAQAHGRDARVAEAMVDAAIEIEGLVDAGKILTLSAGKAQEIGFADGTAADATDAVRSVGIERPAWLEIAPSAAERVARFVTDPTVSQLLLTLGLLGLAFELFTVGWGLGGSVALLALGLFFGGHLIAGLTGWESVVLFVGGLVLLLIEIFVIPGFGLVGGIGFIALLSGLFIVFPDPGTAFQSIAGAVAAAAVIMIVLYKFLPRNSPWRKIVLKTELADDEGYFASDSRDRLLGKMGEALTRLRPSGTVVIEGDRIDAVTEGSWVDAGSPVKVVAVEGARVVVREVKSREEALTGEPAGPQRSE